MLYRLELQSGKNHEGEMNLNLKTERKRQPKNNGKLNLLDL